MAAHSSCRTWSDSNVCFSRVARDSGAAAVDTRRALVRVPGSRGIDDFGFQEYPAQICN